jgi:quinolinate synthase
MRGAVRILPGAEVAATPEVLEHLAALPRLGGGSYLLLEPPLIGLPNFLEELVFGIQLTGTKVVLAHPECSPEVVAASDFSGSTTAMIKFVERTTAPRYLLLTECAMGDNIAAANPDKNMLRLCSVRCPHMNQITLEDTLESLKKNQYVIDVPEEVRVRAARAVERMIAIG